jgi:Arc/MetJ-type ribon-helix-helix transcriptional regulator
MPQLNLHVTPEFEAELDALMKGRGLRSKSEAVRLAIHEAAAPFLRRRPNLDVLIGFVARLPGGQDTSKSGAELLAEIDAEMEAKLDRLGGKS